MKTTSKPAKAGWHKDQLSMITDLIMPCTCLNKGRFLVKLSQGLAPLAAIILLHKKDYTIINFVPYEF